LTPRGGPKLSGNAGGGRPQLSPGEPEGGTKSIGGPEQIEQLPLKGMLSALARDQAVVLCRLGRPERFPEGTVLFKEGEVSGRVVLILFGTVKASSLREDGREILFAVLGPGDLIGELSALDGRPHSATATVLEPADVLLIPADDFRAYVEAHSHMALLLLKILSGRLRDADRKRVEFGDHEATGRSLKRPG
jgi:CRP/FNR family cyclic AMP-dependent transcriptional regulator